MSTLVAPSTEPAAVADDELQQRLAQMRAASRLELFLDYDGTLVPLAESPPQAVPDAELMALLLRLAERPATGVHVVSGRPREVLDQWFGPLPLGLHAEHGYWWRSFPGDEWRSVLERGGEWTSGVAELLEDVTRRTPNSFVEMKTASIAWHYRSVEPSLAEQRLSEARARLTSAMQRSSFELLEGTKVLEVRQRGVHKGLAVARVLGADNPAAVLAAGDDTTDEDLFAALPPQAVSIHVGARATRAHYRVRSPDALRKHLAGFLDP